MLIVVAVAVSRYVCVCVSVLLARNLLKSVTSDSITLIISWNCLQIDDKLQL